MRAAILNSQSNKVENVIELPNNYDPTAEGAYVPPKDHKIETKEADKAIIGGYFKNGVWEPPPPVVSPPIPTPVATLQEQVDALTVLLVAKGTITQAQATAMKAPKPAGPPT